MQALYETVGKIIAAGRIGVPVFVRCLVQLPPNTEKPEKILASIMNVASLWLNSSPSSLYAQRNDSAYINSTIKYAGGQTAIGITSILPITKAQVDVMLLGNKGAIYHEDDFLLPESDFDDKTVSESLKVAIERSLETGKPEEVKSLE